MKTLLKRHRHRRAQLSLELIVLLAVLLSAFAVIFLSTSTSVSVTRAKVYHDQARVAVDMLIEEAERVHSTGVGSQRTILLRLPETVDTLLLGDDYVIVSLLVRGGQVQEVYGQFSMPVSGTLPDSSGRHRVVITSTTQGVVFSS